uniref:Uncharacterized protein n=1 Tax=Rhizophagus irregularis (strain DAOM 181602 / DAOM 197198 / MUCL 43194) TaxID=747089 RepID=U9SXD3_RHIID
MVFASFPIEIDEEDLATVPEEVLGVYEVHENFGPSRRVYEADILRFPICALTSALPPLLSTYLVNG